MLSVIREAISELPTFRVDSKHWLRCAYHEVTHPEFGRQDANALERYRFLIALQYEHIPDDEFLVRFLFDQEVIARSNDDFQGCGEALRLASYLLSRWKRGGDFWRFVEAKCANFDTLCGYDAQWLFAVGRDIALVEFHNAEHELKEHIQEYLFDENGDGRYSDEDIDDWETGLIAEFLKRPDEEPLPVWIDRAIMFQAFEEGRALLDHYEASQPDLSLSYLCQTREQLGDLKGAIEKRRAKLDMAQDDWDRVSNACSFAKLLLKDGQADEAWGIILGIDDCLSRIEGWNECGLGRNVVEVAFRIANTASSVVARTAFTFACSRESQLKQSSLQILTLAAEAAAVLSDAVQAKRFQAAAQAEQARIDEMLKR